MLAFLEHKNSLLAILCSFGLFVHWLDVLVQTLRSRQSRSDQTARSALKDLALDPLGKVSNLMCALLAMVAMELFERLKGSAENCRSPLVQDLPT